ncbi:MAG: type II toxin-antitoxin system HicA family toxin [Taibaiella sp.]|nr:type II toxin-antitoxin system HicA family toxin [Taibaiella sp.]
MKMPRDLSGKDLIQRLKPYGYEGTRQSGSHIRLTTQKNGEHHITIPNHDPLKLGTLSSILDIVAEHFHITRNDLLQQLFF